MKKIILVLSLSSLLINMVLWNSILEYKGVNTVGPRSSAGLLEQLLINPLENFEIIKDMDEVYIEKSEFLSAEERELVEKQSTESRIVEVYKGGGELLDQMVIETNTEGIASTKNSLKFLLQAFFTHPSMVLDSYLTNYLGLINIYQPSTTNSRDYEIDKQFKHLGCQENCAIATVIGQNRNNIYYIPDYMLSRVIDYEQSLNTPFLFRVILNRLKTLSILSFNFSLLLLPFVFVLAVFYAIFMRKRLSKNLMESMYLVIILLGYSLLHLLIHTVTSAVIDRYASPAYVPTILGYIGFLSIIGKSLKENKIKKLLKNAQ